MICYDSFNHPKRGMQLNTNVATLTFLFAGNLTKAFFRACWGTTSTAHMKTSSRWAHRLSGRSSKGTEKKHNAMGDELCNTI